VGGDGPRLLSAAFRKVAPVHPDASTPHARPVSTAQVPVARLTRRLLVHLRAALRLTGLAAWRGVVGMYRRDDLTFASSVAYYALLSLFPFFLLVLSLLGRLTAGEGQRAAVLGFVLHYFPGQFEFVTTQLDALRQASIPLGLAGSVLIIWASLGVFGALTTAVDHAWGVERQRSYLKHKLVAFSMMTAASALLMAGLILISAMSLVESSTFGAVLMRVPGVEALRGLIARSAVAILPIVVAGLIYYFVPNAKVRFSDVWVGAILTGLLWRGALLGFQWYLRDMSRLNVIHGSIAAVVVFLVWVYVSAVILLYGVEFTAAYARLRRHRPEAIPAAPSPRV
jgi:membrane protein